MQRLPNLEPECVEMSRPGPHTHTQAASLPHRSHRQADNFPRNTAAPLEQKGTAERKKERKKKCVVVSRVRVPWTCKMAALWTTSLSGRQRKFGRGRGVTSRNYCDDILVSPAFCRVVVGQKWLFENFIKVWRLYSSLLVQVGSSSVPYTWVDVM